MMKFMKCICQIAMALASVENSSVGSVGECEVEYEEGEDEGEEEGEGEDEAGEAEGEAEGGVEAGDIVVIVYFTS